MDCGSCNDNCAHACAEQQVDLGKLFEEQFARLQRYAQLKDAVDPAEKDVLVDATIFRFTRAVDVLMALVYQDMQARGLECESEEQFLVALMASGLFDEKEAEALLEILQVSGFLADAGDEDREQVYEIMDEVDVYVKALELFASKFASECTC